jgi:hypothetical protein
VFAYYTRGARRLVWTVKQRHVVVKCSQFSAAVIMAVLGLFLPKRCVFAQTNPVNVVSLGSVSGTIGGVALAENYLYLANRSGLQIFDVSNPNSPNNLGFKDANQYAYWVQIEGDLAYVVYSETLRIFNISNRTNPVVVGHIDGAWGTIAVSGGRAYLYGGVGGPPYAISIYDVSTPSLPILVGQFVAVATRIAVSGDYAYFVEATLNTADVSDPANAKLLDSAYCRGIDMVQSGNYAYVACQTNGFQIFDVSNPTNIASVYHSIGDVYTAVAVSGNYAYLVGFYKFSVFDVSNPTNAHLVASVGPPEGFAYGQLGLAVVRGYAYLSYSIGMSVFSLGLPTPPPLNITSKDTSIICSWSVPSPAFAVQESPDLNPAHWTTLTNSSVVVGSQNEVTIPEPQGTMFYRLASQ